MIKGKEWLNWQWENWNKIRKHKPVGFKLYGIGQRPEIQICVAEYTWSEYRISHCKNK